MIAITLPLELRSAPPLLPELIAASVIIRPVNVTLLTVIDLSKALIIPVVTDCPSPSALPYSFRLFALISINSIHNYAISFCFNSPEKILTSCALYD